MTTCQMAGGSCSRPATTLIRIGPPVGGDRALCDDCIAILEGMGMYLRRLEGQPVPRWRNRDLSRDETGRLIKGAA